MRRSGEAEETEGVMVKTAVERFLGRAFGSGGIAIGLGLCELADAVRTLQPVATQALDTMILRLARRQVGGLPCWCSQRADEMDEIPSACHEPECKDLREYFKMRRF